MWGKLLGVAFALLLLILVGLTLFVTLGIGAFLWDQHPLLLVAVACGGATLAIMLLRRSGPDTTDGPQAPPRIHPGISMHAIPIAGGIGLLFAIGYVVMFWSGAPRYRPIVLGAAALGVVFGALLIRARRPQRADPGGTSVLHLASERAGREPADPSPDEIGRDGPSRSCHRVRFAG